MFRPAAGHKYNSSSSFSHLKDTLFGKESWAVSELQQQVADLKVEKEQLLKAVTEQEHDAACLAEHVAQIVQLKHVLATMQQENADKASKRESEDRSTSRPSSPDLESLETQVVQLQSRLRFMEDEKARLTAAAKSKNKQVTALEQRCQQLEAEVQKLAQSWSEAAPAEGIQVARQGSMAEQQMHQQQLQALHDDLQAVREQYKADAESWSSEQAALQANLAALAAQTALKSLALDAMMRNNRASQVAGVHAIGGPLWQQDQETLTQALIAEKEWLQTLTDKIAEVQVSMKQSDTQSASLPISSGLQPTPPQAQGGQTPATPTDNAAARQQQQAPHASDTSISAISGVQSTMIGTEAAEVDNSSVLVLPVTAADAVVEAPARLQLTLGAELADDEHYMVHEQHQRKHRYTSDAQPDTAKPKASLVLEALPGSRRTTRRTEDNESSWTLMSHTGRMDADVAKPADNATVGTLAEDADALMKGVFAAGAGSLFLNDGVEAKAGGNRVFRLTADVEANQPLTAKASLKQALYGR